MAEYEDYSKTLTEFFERMTSWEQDLVSSSEVSLPQMHVIEVIGNHGRLRMKELADLLGVTTGTLTVMADRLEERGYVYRSRDSRDRRSYFIALTDKGFEEYRKHHRMHIRLVEEIVELLGKEEAASLFSKLKKIRNIL